TSLPGVHAVIGALGTRVAASGVRGWGGRAGLHPRSFMDRAQLAAERGFGRWAGDWRPGGMSRAPARWRREVCERAPAGAVRKLLKMAGKTRHARREPVFHAALRGSGGTQARAGRRRSDDASGVALRNAPCAKPRPRWRNPAARPAGAQVV